VADNIILRINKLPGTKFGLGPRKGLPPGVRGPVGRGPRTIRGPPGGPRGLPGPKAGPLGPGGRGPKGRGLRRPPGVGGPDRMGVCWSGVRGCEGGC
jgi:hypothetical protein